MKKFLRLGALAALGLSAAAFLGANAPRADYASERRIQMYNIHTEESIDIVYKKDGQYIPEALEKLNYFMRDWRANKVTKMDPHTIDIVWELHEELGSKEPIHLICGYRTSDTNEALRNAGGGQAKQSQHILGKAMDVTFPDVPVQKLRYAGLVHEEGGVGYYPTSGVPFVHIDSGNVRMWPRMGRYELALLFPNGHSAYVPDDGKPISTADVSYARGHFTQLADAIAAFHQFRASPHDRTMVASLEADAPAPAAPAEPVDAPTVVKASAPAGKPAVVASADLDAPALNGPALKAAPAKLVVKPQAPVAAGMTLASLAPAPRPKTPIAATVSTVAAKAPALAPAPSAAPDNGGDQTAFLDKNGWVSAPDYDEDHDSELSYRPFSLAGLIEADPSIDNPVLAKLTRPDLGAAHQSIGDNEDLGLQFRPHLQLAEAMWTATAKGGDAVAALFTAATQGNAEQGQLVRTSSAD